MAEIQTQRDQRNTSSNGVFLHDDFIDATNLNLNISVFFFFNESTSSERELSYLLGVAWSYKMIKNK